MIREMALLEKEVGVTTSMQPVQSMGQMTGLVWPPKAMKELLRFLICFFRDVFEALPEVWGYTWTCWLHHTGLQEGYWYIWWYCIPLDLILYLLYPILSKLGPLKFALLVLECHLFALPILHATYPGLKSLARDAMTPINDACWHMIQNFRDRVQAWLLPTKLELSKGILLRLGEGYEFQKDKLVQLWMAAGFIKNEPMEINGANYFEKLVSKGYILPSDSNSMYKVNSEKMNSYKIWSNSNYLRLENTSQSEVANAKILHVSVLGDDINENMFKTLGKFDRLRTLLLYGSRIRQVPVDLVLSFKSLVVLDLSRTNINELPSSALKMIHLRYLDLSWTLIEYLPESIGHFQRLQTLKLTGCSHLWRLPKDMKKLTELRHLDFDVLGQLAVMPEGISVLVKLRTLSAFIVSSQQGCGIGELRDLNNLTGDFCIARLENVQSLHDAKTAYLTNKKNLKKLELRWSEFSLQARKNQDLDDSVLENLCPHPDLEELLIRCYGGNIFPSWVGGESFHNLASITLFKCEHVSMLPSLQKLPALEFLGLTSLNSMIEMDIRSDIAVLEDEGLLIDRTPPSLQNVTSLDYLKLFRSNSVTEMGFRGEMDHAAFPKLRRLIIDEMLNLNSWLESGKGDFPCLVELAIKHCPNLPELPSLVYLSTLERLEICSCPKVQFVDDKELPTSLKFLSLEDCPLIKESWLEERNNWDKIKHVQNLWIDQEAIWDPTDDSGSELLEEDYREMGNDGREELIDCCDFQEVDDSGSELLEEDYREMGNDGREELPLFEESYSYLVEEDCHSHSNDHILVRLMSSWEYFARVAMEEGGVGEQSSSSMPTWQFTGQATGLSWLLQWLPSFIYHRRDIFENFREAWGYTWLCWLMYAGLQEGYWYIWWFYIPIDLILCLFYPILRNLGIMKFALIVFECHVLAPPIIRATIPGLRTQARDARRLLCGTCCRGIQILRAKLQGCVLLLKLELSKQMLILLGEGYEFQKDKLIQLWMAAGFIQYEPMEIHGANYFEKLISKGYILPSDSNSFYRVNSEKLNPIRSNSNYLRLENTSRSDVANAKILHVSVLGDDINENIFKALGKFDRLRTLLFYGSRIRQVPVDLVLCFESLVVLDLSRTNIIELPSSALKMIHLRYLDLSWTLVEYLPESIGYFQRLQTLKLRGCSNLWRLPKEMKRLTELRHLDFDVLGQLSAMPEGVGVLVNLRTLSGFIAGTQEGCRVGELRNLNNLTDELCIARLENVQSEHDVEMASLTDKKNLTKLELRWSDFPLQERDDGYRDFSVLENLCPHSDLKELLIRCYGGIRFPSWIGSKSFHRLSSITLFKCKHVSMLPSLQKLPSLEYVALIGLNSVIEVCVRGEENHLAFPKLQKLVIDEMLNLHSWLEGRKADFPSLVELTIKQCPKLPDLPSLVYLATLKRLEISSCPAVQFVDNKKLSTSLEVLIVEDCPLIKESCLKEEGRNWDMIKHVRNIWIDQEALVDSTDDDDDDDKEVPLVEDSFLEEEDYDESRHVEVPSSAPVPDLFDLVDNCGLPSLSFIVKVLSGAYDLNSLSGRSVKIHGY